MLLISKSATKRAIAHKLLSISLVHKMYNMNQGELEINRKYVVSQSYFITGNSE